MTARRTPLEAWIKARVGLQPHQELTREALGACQLERLQATLDYVKRCSPFYRRLFADRTAGSVKRQVI